MDKEKKIIEAEEFRLVDSEGNPRAYFAMENNNPVLSFASKNNKPRLSVGLQSWPDGREEADITFYDETGWDRIRLTTEGARALFNINNKEGRTLVGLACDGERGGVISVTDSMGRPRFLIMAEDNKPLCVIITDENGNAIKELELKD